ncbi:MAG: serine hydroxymethyltransferase [Oscillospiraceae bacterium]|nr:serine hydroxymethyltransferase [Oscillospiraceae bacterium]
MQNKLRENLDYLTAFDPELAGLIGKEFTRQNRNIELIASENVASPAVIAAMGSVLTNKYAEGYPGRRYYGGCDYVDELEGIAIARAKALFGAEFANVQPHSGAQANLEVYAALLQPGNTLLGMDLQSGGHLSHGASVNLSGKLYHSVSYGVNAETGRIDYDQVEDLVRQHRPKLVIAGASAYPRAIDFRAFADIAHRNGALLMVDMAHIAGLVAGGMHQNPVPYADVVTTTTHKTLRGPRGGMILARAEFAKKLNSAVFPGTQGGPLMHVIAAKAVCLKEAMQPQFAEYARRVVENARALADGLLERGIPLVSGGTDNHLMLADLRGLGISGRELQTWLDAVRITVNKNAIPHDPASPSATSGVRIGTPAVTTRGFDLADMREIADCICQTAADPVGSREDVLRRVAAMTARHPLYRDGV